MGLVVLASLPHVGARSFSHTIGVARGVPSTTVVFVCSHNCSWCPSLRGKVVAMGVAGQEFVHMLVSSGVFLFAVLRHLLKTIVKEICSGHDCLQVYSF